VTTFVLLAVLITSTFFAIVAIARCPSVWTLVAGSVVAASAITVAAIAEAADGPGGASRVLTCGGAGLTLVWVLEMLGSVFPALRHGWFLRTPRNTRGALIGAVGAVSLTIALGGDTVTESRALAPAWLLAFLAPIAILIAGWLASSNTAGPAAADSTTRATPGHRRPDGKTASSHIAQASAP
jgi:hypothetical protein